MEKHPKKLVLNLSERLQLPAEATVGVSIVELTGNRRLRVENHRGVGAFGAEYMELLVPDGEIIVRGQELVLLVMNNRELIVSGIITSLELPPC